MNSFHSIAFQEAEGFTEKVAELLSDADYARFQRDLALHPEKGELIRQTGGARKVRIALPGRGKRGGGRVVYYYRVAETIYFLLIYAKSEQEDLTAIQLQWIRSRIEEIRKGDE